MEPGLEAVNYYDPPNMTYPFGAYICVVDIDKDTGEAGPPLLCAGRLRHADQPHGDRGPGARRADRGFRHRDGPGDRLRPSRATSRAHRSWTSSCRPRSRPRSGRPTSRSRPRRTTRSAPRAWARARTSAASRRSRTRSTTRSPISGSRHIPMPHTAARLWRVCHDLGLTGQRGCRRVGRAPAHGAYARGGAASGWPRSAMSPTRSSPWRSR